MWMLFEGLEAHNIEAAFLDEINNISERIHRDFPDHKLDIYFFYFQRRYIDGPNETDFFEGLNIRNPDLRENILNELKQPTNKLSKFVTVLKIVYILRNNLFHGLKDVASLEKQCSNLKYSSSFLQNLIKYSNRYVYIKNDA